MLELPKDFKPSSFWERTEGTTGMIFGIPLAAGLLYVLYKLLPFIIELFQNLIWASILGAVLTAIVYALFIDRRILTLASYAYKSIMRGITQIFVQIDPIGILRNYASNLRKNAKDMENQIRNLSGQMNQLKEAIDSNENERQKALKVADLAQRKGEQGISTLKVRKAGRLKDSNVTLNTLYTKMEFLHRVLRKMYEASLIMIEDIEDEVDVQEKKRKFVLASYSAFRSALKIINGDQDQKELFEQTIRYLTEDYGKKVGEIKEFMDMSANFIKSIDLQNGVFEEDAMKQLEEWEQQTGSLILHKGEKQELIAQSEDPGRVLDLNEPLPPREEVLAKREKRQEQPPLLQLTPIGKP